MTEENVKTALNVAEKTEVKRPDLTGLPGMLSEDTKKCLRNCYEAAVNHELSSVTRTRDAWLCLYVDSVHGISASSLKEALDAIYGETFSPFEPWAVDKGLGEDDDGCLNTERFRFVSYAIGVPYPEQSLELTRFYRSLEDRIKAGDNVPNICAALHRAYPVGDLTSEIYWEVSEEVQKGWKDAGLHPDYPFNNGTILNARGDFTAEEEGQTFYQNPVRCRWVHEHTNRPGVVIGGDLPAFYPCVQSKTTTVPGWANPERFRLITRSGHYKNVKTPSWKLPAAILTLWLLGTGLALLLGGCL